MKESTPVRFDLENNLCSSRSGETLIALSQDFLTSSFLITRKDTFYDHRTLLHIWSYMGDDMDPNDLPPPAIMKVRILDCKYHTSLITYLSCHMQI